MLFDGTMSSLTHIDVALRTDHQHRQARHPFDQIVVADRASHTQVEFNAVPGNPTSVQIRNLGEPSRLVWHHRSLETNQTATVTLPVHLVHGNSHVELRLPAARHPAELQTIARGTDRNGQQLAYVLDRPGTSPGPETLAKWFTALEQLQGQAGSSELFAEAAKIITSPGGMTGAIIALRRNNDWQVVGSHLPDPEMGIAFDRELVEEAARRGTTCYHDATQSAQRTDADTAVASPILDKHQQVVGAVYAYRSCRTRNRRRSIRAFEALWIQLVAGSIAAAIARQHAETQAARAGLLLEQTFAAEVIDEIRHNPQALAGQERETTILFADLRHSTALSAQLNATDTYRLLSECLEVMTEHVLERRGVIIDYYGDGLAAMWNAPVDQLGHARLACQTAQAMVREIEKLNCAWQDRLSQPLRIGVGINTGICRVGNAGTERRLKYGPRGRAVVLASRLEAAAKKLGTPILLGPDTVACLAGRAATRRVCKATFAGIKKPVDVFELCALDSSVLAAELVDFIAQYQTALDLCEAGDWVAAEEMLAACAQSRTAGQSSARFMLEELQERRSQQRRSSPRTGLDRRNSSFVVDFVGRLDDDNHHPSF